MCLTYGILFFIESKKSDQEDNAIDYTLLGLGELTAVVGFVALAGAVFLFGKGALDGIFMLVIALVCGLMIGLSRVGIYNALSTPNEPNLDYAGWLIGIIFIVLGSVAGAVFIATIVYKRYKK